MSDTGNTASVQFLVAIDVRVRKFSALHEKHLYTQQNHCKQKHYDRYQYNLHEVRFQNFVQIYERFMRFYRLFQNIFVT